MHHIYTYIHGRPHKSQTDAHSSHMNTGSTDGFIPIPSVAEEDGCLLVKIRVYIYIYINTHTHTHTHIYVQCGSLQQLSSDAGLRCPVAAAGSQFLQLLTPGCECLRGCSPTPAAGTEHLTHTHSWPGLS